MGHFAIWILSVLFAISVDHLVLAQPEELSIDILEDNNDEVKMTIQVIKNSNRTIRLSEGQSYNLSCRTDVGFNNGDPNYVWFHIDQNGTETPITNPLPSDLISPSLPYVIQIEDNYQYTLRFQRINSSHVGTYMCKANFGIEKIIIEFGNPTVITGNYMITAIENALENQYQLQDIFISGNPRPPLSNVTWYHNGNEITSSYRNIVILPDVKTLLLPINIQFYHQGLYTVTVTSSIGTATDSFYLNIEAIPYLELSIDSGPVVLLGSQVRLTCIDSKGTPIPEFFWFVNNTLITNGGGYTISQESSNTSILTISNVNINHVGGQYKCLANNSAGMASESLTLPISFPPPSLPQLSLTPSDASFHYAGSQLTLSCTTTLQTSPHYSGSLTAVMTWKRNNKLLTDTGSRITTTQSNEALTYSSVLSISAVSNVSDNGSYVCEVSTLTADGISSTVVVSESIDVITQVPPLSVDVDPQAVSNLLFSPYNTVHLNCTSNMPPSLSITPFFTWYNDMDNSSLSSDSRFIITNAPTYSTLSYTVTESGLRHYRCSVTFDLPGMDSNVTLLSVAAVIDVKEPVSPRIPNSIVSGNIDHRSAVIQWRVESISYSPESYYVKYGTSRDNLMFVSDSINGSTDLDTRDEILSIKLIHLNHNQDYYYVVVARNLNGETTSNIETFTTRKLALAQFKAGPFRGCSNGRVLDSSVVQTFMKEKISEYISTVCTCSFSIDNLVNGTLYCVDTTSDELIYRVYVIGTGDIGSTTIINHLMTWVKSGPEIISGAAKITMDTSCPVNLSSIHDPVCTSETTEPPSTGSVEEFGSNTDILIVVISGAVILLEFVIIFILLLALCYQNNKIRVLSRKKNNYMTVRRQSSVISDGGHSGKWKGDAYVTTECPAYLSTYNPKSDQTEIEIEHEATPAIYDSIDHLNRRNYVPDHTMTVSTIYTTNGGTGSYDTDDTTGSSTMT